MEEYTVLGTTRSDDKVETLKKQEVQCTAKTYHKETKYSSERNLKTAKMDIDSAETATVVGLENNGTIESKSGVDLTGTVNMPKFYLPMENIVLELIHHAERMDSVLKTDRLYKMEDMEEHFIVLSGIRTAHGPGLI